MVKNPTADSPFSEINTAMGTAGIGGALKMLGSFTIRFAFRKKI
jgi:hypothetical protein